MKRTTLVGIILLLALFALVACERLAPGSQTAPPTATTGAPLPAVTLPPLGASPTPAFVATPELVLPLVSPTPGGEVAPPVEPPPAEEPPPAVEPTPEPPPAATGEQIHIVQPGDNLYRIAERYGFTYQELAAYNGIANPDRIDVGQQIKIPPRP